MTMHRHTAPMSLAKTARLLQIGRLSAVAAVESALERIALVEPSVHAWVQLDAEGAFASAERLDRLPAVERGPLHGVPVGVKDIIDVRGLPTRCGSKLRGGIPARADAAIVARLRALGAVVLGKTVTTEFAYFNPGPTANPHDTGRTPGGSSSGSAAAVAAGMVPLALGTQTAASVSRPASYCGVSGYVAARGSFDEAGITGLSPSLDSLGFLTASAADLAFLYRVLAGSPVTAACPATALAPPTVFSWAPGNGFGIEPAMLDALDWAGRALAGLGHQVLPLDFDARGEELIEAHTTVMARDAVCLRRSEAGRPQDISPQLAALFDAGRAVSDGAYAAAHAEIRRQSAWLREQLAGDALLLAPAAQGPAPSGLAATGSPIMSRPWQALGLPVVVVPGLTDPETDMPLGVQLACMPGAEDVLFAAAAGLEQQLVAAARPAQSAAG